MEPEIPWLVRVERSEGGIGTSIDFALEGPFSREVLCQKIQEGSYQAKDEICAGNSFWISLYESDLLASELGLSLPPGFFSPSLTDEITETATEVTVPELILSHESGKITSSAAPLDSPLKPSLEEGATTVVVRSVTQKGKGHSLEGGGAESSHLTDPSGPSQVGERHFLHQPLIFASLVIGLSAIGLFFAWQLIQLLIRH